MRVRKTCFVISVCPRGTTGLTLDGFS